MLGYSMAWIFMTSEFREWPVEVILHAELHTWCPFLTLEGKVLRAGLVE